MEISISETFKKSSSSSTFWRPYGLMVCLSLVFQGSWLPTVFPPFSWSSYGAPDGLAIYGILTSPISLCPLLHISFSLCRFSLCSLLHIYFSLCRFSLCLYESFAPLFAMFSSQQILTYSSSSLCRLSMPYVSKGLTQGVASAVQTLFLRVLSHHLLIKRAFYIPISMYPPFQWCSP